MPRGEYIVLTLIGSTIWNTLLIGAGYLLGSQWERVADAIGRLSTPVLIIAGLAVAALVARRFLRAPATRGNDEFPSQPAAVGLNRRQRRPRAGAHRADDLSAEPRLRVRRGLD
jgi:hypothetical protein